MCVCVCVSVFPSSQGCLVELVGEAEIDDIDMDVCVCVRACVSLPPRWDHRLSVAVPDEEIFYIVAFLRNKLPSRGPSLAALMEDNAHIMRICEPLRCKQYLPRYEDRLQWKRHFGSKWDTFVHNKQLFDPLALLAPGQNIFPRRRNYLTNPSA